MITRTSRSCNIDLISSNSSYSDDGNSGKCYHLYCYCCYCCSKCRLRQRQIDIEHLNINGSNELTLPQDGSATIRTTATTITETVVPPSSNSSLPTAIFLSNCNSLPNSESNLTDDHLSNTVIYGKKKDKNSSTKTTTTTSSANMNNCIQLKWPVQLFTLVTIVTLFTSSSSFAATLQTVATTNTQQQQQQLHQEQATQYNSTKPVTISTQSINSLLPQASAITSSTMTIPSASSFDRTLSPRQIKTKYGFLRGILISVPSSFTSTSMSTSSSSSSSSVNSMKDTTGPSSTVTTTATTAAAAAATAATTSSINSGQNVPYHQRQQPSSKQQLTHLSSSSTGTLEPVEAFLGVPYASPPLGSLRFMPPVTPSHWRGVRMANSLGPSCPQKLPKFQSNLSSGRMDYIKKMKQFTDHHSEDCLYLNLYAPLNRGKPVNLTKVKCPFAFPSVCHGYKDLFCSFFPFFLPLPLLLRNIVSSRF